MEPENKSQRTKAFLNFLLLFVISIALIAGTIFSSREIPFKQNDQLRKTMDQVERERMFADKFTNKMSGISAMLDSVNITSQSERLDILIGEEINKLDIMLEVDSISNKTIYRNIMLSLRDLRVAKKLLRSSTGKEAETIGLKTENADLKKQIETLKNEKFQLEQQNLRLQH